MAQPKKTSRKTKRLSEPSTATKSKEVVEGAAVEKPAAAQSTPTMNDTAKPQDQPSTSQACRWSKMLASQNAALLMSTIAFVLALIASAFSIVTFQHKADEPASDQPAPSAAMNGVDEADLNKLNQRLDTLATLIAQNADHFESLQQEHADATATRLTDLPTIANLDNLMSRIATLEAAVTDQMAPSAVTDEPAFQVGFNTTQLGLLVAAGLLAENLAGRDIKIWAVVLDDLQWPDVDVADRDIIRDAASTPVDSRADLLSVGRLQLTPMVQGLNKTDERSGLLEQVRARLADLIRLRRTNGGSNQPETVLESFESALENADFDAAFAAAKIWSSAGLTGLESWLTAAQRRHDLDQAVNRLVAIFVQHAVGQN